MLKRAPGSVLTSVDKSNPGLREGG